MIPKTIQESNERAVQAAAHHVRAAMNRGMSHAEALADYARNSTFGPKLREQLANLTRP